MQVDWAPRFIVHICLECYSPTALAKSISHQQHLRSASNGSTHINGSAAAGKAGSKVREAIFKYLERFLKELGPDRAHKYCAQIIATCLFAYKREDSNPAKGATFLPLQCILDWDLSVPDDHTASELAIVYQSSYQRLKSLTGTVKGDILQTLGQLLQARPQVSNVSLKCPSSYNPRTCSQARSQLW